jgi:hypothetical protein
MFCASSYSLSLRIAERPATGNYAIFCKTEEKYDAGRGIVEEKGAAAPGKGRRPAKRISLAREADFYRLLAALSACATSSAAAAIKF